MQQTDRTEFKTNQFWGKLIGLFAPDTVGPLTHHGTQSHMHLLLETMPHIAARFEGVKLSQGAILRLPVP